jgi:hypothetical protein
VLTGLEDIPDDDDGGCWRAKQMTEQASIVRA